MFIEVIHINGRYSPETGQHTVSDHLPDDYYSKLASTLARAASTGASVLYRPNLVLFDYDISSDPDELERALGSDPFLNSVGDEIDGLQVVPDGLRRDLAVEGYTLEDRLLREQGLAIVLGAYTKWCVPATAYNIASRNPGYLVGIDSTLSIDNDGDFIDPAHRNVPHISVAKLIETK